MTRKSQSQRSGNQSTNTQIDTQNNYGLTYEEVRQTALDVFKANFYDLHKEAKEIAEARARKITEDILDEVFENKEHLIGNFSDPDIASALVEAQKVYAKSGEENTENILVSLISKRLEVSDRTQKNICLNEAIRKMEVMDPDSLNFLYVLQRSIRISFNNGNPIGLSRYLKEQYDTFAHLIPSDNFGNQIAFLEYAGMLNVRAGERKRLLPLLHTYMGTVFTKGISTSDFPIDDLTTKQKKAIWFPYQPEGDLSKFALQNDTKPEQKEYLLKHDWSEENIAKILPLQTKARMNQNEIKSFILKYFPNLEKLIGFRDARTLINCELTPVARLIADAMDTKI